MKLNATQMLGLTVGALLTWSLCKAARRARQAQSSTADSQSWSPSLQTASGASEVEDPDADPSRQRQPSVGDLPP